MLTRTIVTQQMLADLVRYREIARRCESLRQAILEALDNNAMIERGRYRVEIREVESRQLNRRKLERLLGVEEVERLVQLVEPTRSRQLIISPAHFRDPLQSHNEGSTHGH